MKIYRNHKHFKVTFYPFTYTSVEYGNIIVIYIIVKCHFNTKLKFIKLLLY